MWRKKIDIGLSAALNKLMTTADYERHTSSFQQWWTRLQKDVWPLFWQRGFSDHTCLLEYCTQMIHACLIFSLFFNFLTTRLIHLCRLAPHCCSLSPLLTPCASNTWSSNLESEIKPAEWMVGGGEWRWESLAPAPLRLHVVHISLLPWQAL